MLGLSCHCVDHFYVFILRLFLHDFAVRDKKQEHNNEEQKTKLSRKTSQATSRWYLLRNMIKSLNFLRHLITKLFKKTLAKCHVYFVVPNAMYICDFFSQPRLQRVNSVNGIASKKRIMKNV